MNKQLIIVGLIVILLTVGLSGCNENIVESDEEKIISKWFFTKTKDELTIMSVYNFYSNKTFMIVATTENKTNMASGTWRIVDNKLILDFIEPLSTIVAYDYNFSNNDNDFNMIDSFGVEYNLKRI